MANCVENLLKYPFSTYTWERKFEIKRLGPPRPALELVQFIAGKRPYKRKFLLEYYNTYDWLCGCPVNNKLYCFPCLLFEGENVVWSKYGYTDLNHLSFKGQKHEGTKNHLHNVASLAFLGQTNIAESWSDINKKNIMEYNRKVTDNRYVLNIIVNCIKFCGCFELALRGPNEGQDSLNPAVFNGLINYSAKLDSALKTHVEKSTVFSAMSKTIQNDLLDCMFDTCQDQIMNEIKEADYFSIIADETSDVSNIFQMALIFRYTWEGKPQERFFQFLQPTAHDAAALSESILEVLKTIEFCRCKLIGQTYDGASVTSGDNMGVPARIKQVYPNANFIHCFAHQLNVVVSKAVSINTNVRVFFANVTGLSSFFSNSPQRTAVLHEILNNGLPPSRSTRLNFISRSVNTIFENKDQILECLEKLRDESLNHETIHQAAGFAKILEDESFRFWLKIFHPIMIHVDILYANLQKRNVNAEGVRLMTSKFEREILTFRDSSINEIILSEPPPEKKLRLNEQLSLLEQAKEVCDTILVEIKERFSFTGHLTAASILNNDQFPKYNKKFPKELVEELIKRYPIEKGRLKTELEVIYDSENFADIPDAQGFLEVIRKVDLLSHFKEVYKLCSIVCASPISSSEAERAFSVLERIKSFLRNSMNHQKLNALAMLAIEKDMVHRMPDFNEKVINKFAVKKDKIIALNYKV